MELGLDMQNMNRTQCAPIGAVEKIMIGGKGRGKKH
jgi:hypothetical protein